MKIGTQILYTLAIKGNSLNEELFLSKSKQRKYTIELSEAIFVESRSELPFVDMKHYYVMVEKGQNGISVLKKDSIFKKVKRTSSLLAIC
jgi:hypothetical protein